MTNDYERWDFWNRETENKETILKKFQKKISNQKNIETEITKLVNENFWELVEDNKESAE